MCGFKLPSTENELLLMLELRMVFLLMLLGILLTMLTQVLRITWMLMPLFMMRSMQVLTMIVRPKGQH